jgi:hypothetical protein
MANLNGILELENAAARRLALAGAGDRSARLYFESRPGSVSKVFSLQTRRAELSSVYKGNPL